MNPTIQLDSCPVSQGSITFAFFFLADASDLANWILVGLGHSPAEQLSPT